ncbi:MAG: hypothetical protein NTX97_05275 [Bacteroidetes bacterium]|nr:hypothetical protein [Bacteroidota bacterium]
MKFKILLSFLFLIPMLGNSQVIIVEWNFPNSPDDATADAGIAGNLAKTISTVTTGALSFGSSGVSTKSAEAPDGWALNDYWLIDFVSTGYSNLSISSAQRSNSNGPRDFDIQYSITGSGGPWTTVTTSTAGNGSWVTLATFPLPAACDNQAEVFIRWLVSSNIQADGGSGISGTVNSRIDDIIITSAVSPAASSADCAGGITICSNATFIGSSSGGGNYSDFNASNTDCLDPPEHQTSWYYFSSTSNGNIGFTITPALTSDDYDWAIWGPMATVTCPPSAAPIRCSAADGNSKPANITGLKTGAGDNSEGPSGDGWVESLNVLAGQVYVLVIGQAPLPLSL